MQPALLAHNALTLPQRRKRPTRPARLHVHCYLALSFRWSTQAQIIVLIQVLLTYVSSLVYFFDPSWSDSGEPLFDQTGDIMLVLFNSAIFVFLVLVLCRNIRSSMTARQLVNEKGMEAYAPQLHQDQDYHLFLSHTWGSGQV